VIIQESKELHDAFLGRLKARYHLVANRSEDGKTHLSDLTHCLTASYWDRTDYEPPTDEQALAFARGWLLEEFSISDIHVEPFEVDGVWMSVDMLLDGLPGDLKSTLLAPETSSGCAVCGEPYTGHSKASSGHVYEKGLPKPFVFPKEWERRFAAYRWALNKTLRLAGYTGALPSVARFGVVVFHLIQAQVKAYELRWTPAELDTAWTWVLERRDTLNRLMAAREICANCGHRERDHHPDYCEAGLSSDWQPACECLIFIPAENPEPFKHNEDYECRNCTYNLRCSLWASLHPELYKEELPVA
jgi:hypothetical protein